ncbi:hypothetical protein ARMSODRAFT_1011461 [Armillaria solidipes]|uniref:Uncharacterized protein n=1 Tax=Armillaria solidipes TaxID=1076256 RepID=A0A2H3C4G1_9AGAR|nr:hypothetical protein ARMSODRAFT_1011461 [Armillaria solidipes]
MFNLAILKDAIGVHLSNFGIPPETALIAELKKKAGEGKVRYRDGFLYHKVIVRLLALTLSGAPHKQNSTA